MAMATNGSFVNRTKPTTVFFFCQFAVAKLDIRKKNIFKRQPNGQDDGMMVEQGERKSSKYFKMKTKKASSIHPSNSIQSNNHR